MWDDKHGGCTYTFRHTATDFLPQLPVWHISHLKLHRRNLPGGYGGRKKKRCWVPTWEPPRNCLLSSSLWGSKASSAYTGLWTLWSSTGRGLCHVAEDNERCLFVSWYFLLWCLINRSWSSMLICVVLINIWQSFVHFFIFHASIFCVFVHAYCGACS